MVEMQPIAPADLLLDEQNPRLSQPNGGQNQTLHAMASMMDKKLAVLAADIVQNGLDPSTLSIVMRVVGTPVRYTVLEGNRRLAALRVLENPESVAEAVKAQTLTRLRKLSRRYQDNPIAEVQCVVVKDKDEARHWIELRHTGENEGAGTLKWGSQESANFKARSGVSEIHSQALDLLQRRGDLSPSLRRKVPATTLKRLMESPDVRAKLGVESQKGTLALLADEKHVVKALMYVVNALASGKTKVGDVYTKQQRQKYARDFPADLAVTATVKSGEGTAAGHAGGPAPKSRAKQASSRKRDRLIPKDCVLNIPSGRIHDIEVELRRLSLEDHTNAVSVLFRVFLELSIDSYIDDNPMAGVDLNTKLRIKVEKVANDLEAKKKINKQQARAIRSANMDTSALAPGVNTMNDYIHNEHIFPAPSDLRAHWNSMQPFIAAMWTP